MNAWHVHYAAHLAVPPDVPEDDAFDYLAETAMDVLGAHDPSVTVTGATGLVEIDFTVEAPDVGAGTALSGELMMRFLAAIGAATDGPITFVDSGAASVELVPA